MGRLEFGQLVKRERQRQSLSLARLGYRIGELSDGTLLDGTAVRSLENGGRAIEDDPELFERVIAVLGIDRDEADVALGRLPEGIDLEDIRELRRTSELKAARQVAATRAAQPSEGARSAAPPVFSEQAGDIMATLLASARQRVAA